jgi:hypothetical protein
MKVLVSVFDMTAKYYQDARVMPHRGEAIRSFVNILDDPEHPMAKHPDSFALYELAEFNEQTGKIEPHASPIKLIGLWEALPTPEKTED